MTQIPTRFDHAAAAARWSQVWDDEGCFVADASSDKPPFCIVIPPPNVTGALHLGHGLNNTLQDILVRTRRMQGFEALWIPGTDHAGIATQAVVERRLKEDENKTRHDLGREALVARIWDWKDQYESRILDQLRRMGCSCDWSRTRFTLDDTCAAAVRATFFDLFAKQRIYRGKRLVNWDTFLQTAVSDDEVFNEPVRGHFYHYRYPVVDPQDGEPTHIEIATTRPETMLGDTAVAVHPDPGSALQKVEDDLRGRLEDCPAKERTGIKQQLDSLIQRRETMLPTLIRLRDMARGGRMLQLPLTDRQIPLVLDAWAKPELGSGAVKITPAHDPNDYEVGQRLDLPMINILHPDGKLNAAAGQYEGLTVTKARKAVIEDLQAAGLMGDIEDRVIELPHSDRSKTPIQPYLADQWFVAMDQLAQSAIDAVADGRVTIQPPRYAKMYQDWLGEKRDWPVSRQLWWGHRIPIWTKSFASQAAAEPKLAKLRSLGDPTEIATQTVTTADGGVSLQVCIAAEHSTLESKVEAFGFVQDPDVLDTWFSSALWPHSTLGWPESTADLTKFYPTSSLITSRDIITLWVARMVLMGINNLGQVPFANVYIHPKILDGQGVTMSKSKGNGVDPVDIIDRFGPDAMRFGLARLATETQDVRLPVQYECPHCEKLNDQTAKTMKAKTVVCSSCKETFSTQWAESPQDTAHPRAAVVSERFETARNFVNKLWNASRFALSHLGGEFATIRDAESLPTEDRWLLSRLASVTDLATDLIDQYQYSAAAALLYDFAWDDFCSVYIEMAKPRLEDPGDAPIARTMLVHTLDQLLRLLHPLMPFVTESVWEHLWAASPHRGLNRSETAASRLALAAWPVAQAGHRNDLIERQFNVFLQSAAAIRQIRASQNIGPREMVPVAIRCDESTADLLGPMKSYFEALANADILAFGPAVEPFETDGHLAVAEVGVDLHVDLEAFIDFEAERARLTKLKSQLAAQINGKEKKLSNENFVARAPADVVEKERDALAMLAEQLQAVDRDLTKLASRNDVVDSAKNPLTT